MYFKKISITQENYRLKLMDLAFRKITMLHLSFLFY